MVLVLGGISVHYIFHYLPFVYRYMLTLNQIIIIIIKSCTDQISSHTEVLNRVSLLPETPLLRLNLNSSALYVGFGACGHL